MGIVIHLDKEGAGGSGTGWNGQVEFRADLPITLGTPAIGEIYLVEKKTTLLGFTTYQSGLYIRDFNNGNLNDWRRLNVKVNFTDSEFAIVNAADTSKKSKFDLSLVSTSTTRTYSLPDKDGTVAMLSDIVGGSTFYTSDGTFTDATRNANISQNNVLNFISKAALPINDKTGLKITANGIFGSLETDLNFRFNGSNAQNYSIYTNNNASFIFDNGIDNISFAIGRGGSGQYLQYFDLNAGFRTDLFFTAPSQNNTLNFPDKSGTLAVLSDIVGGVDDIAASQGFWIQNIITAATLTADVNDWSPTGFDADTDLIRVDIDANNRAITGIVAPAIGVNRILAIKNLNASGNDLRFEHNSASSLAENRFLCRDNSNKSIKPNEIALWFYDHIQQRWTPFNRIG